jgi:hypothetical protein
MARDSDGNEIDARADAAVRFSGKGAILRIAYVGQPMPSRPATDDGIRLALEIREVYVAIDKACGAHFAIWENAPERTHAEVLVVFDTAVPLSPDMASPLSHAA